MIHVLDLEFGGSDDEQIWRYAIENQLIILTKDVDFQNRWLTSGQRTKVVYFELGNLLFTDWYRYLEKNWPIIEREIEHCGMIIATSTTIETIR